MINNVPPQTYELIKHFEGCYLESYLCPAGVWTCGFGNTGEWVTPGLVITQQQANTYLQEAVLSFANSIPDSIWQKLKSNQQAALISFLYNVGLGALDAPSFGKAIRTNISEVPQRLLDWDKAVVDGIKQSLVGLTRRRRSEAILWVTGKVATDNNLLDNWQEVQNLLKYSAPTVSTASPINLVNAAKYFRNDPHQLKAFEYLDSQITPSQRQQFGLLYRALPPNKSLNVLKPSPIFVFDMPLGDNAVDNIIVGTLRLKGFPNGDSLTEWKCTSGQPGYQYSSATSMKGLGALPGHRYIKDSNGNAIKNYTVLTSPYDLTDVKGIEGNAFHILPDPVNISGVWRSELMIHNDSNRLYSPGSAGCIVTITNDSFNEIEQIMSKLRQSGYKEIPLEVNH